MSCPVYGIKAHGTKGARPWCKIRKATCGQLYHFPPHQCPVYIRQDIKAVV